MTTKPVRITGPKTCRIVADITGDPYRCPWIMTREQWNGIKGLVQYRKEQRQDTPSADDFINDLMNMMGMKK